MDQPVRKKIKVAQELEGASIPQLLDLKQKKKKKKKRVGEKKVNLSDLEGNGKSCGKESMVGSAELVISTDPKVGVKKRTSKRKLNIEEPEKSDKSDVNIAFCVAIDSTVAEPAEKMGGDIHSVEQNRRRQMRNDITHMYAYRDTLACIANGCIVCGYKLLVHRSSAMVPNQRPEMCLRNSLKPKGMYVLSLNSSFFQQMNQLSSINVITI
jgi:hypothetical protein